MKHVLFLTRADTQRRELMGIYPTEEMLKARVQEEGFTNVDEVPEGYEGDTYESEEWHDDDSWDAWGTYTGSRTHEEVIAYYEDNS